MSNYQTIPECLALTTVRIRAVDSNGNENYGTGFYFELTRIEDNRIPLIITNEHVVRGADKCFFDVSIDDGRNDQNVVIQKNTFLVEDSQNHWITHPDGKTDLAALPMAPVLKQIYASNRKPLIKFIERSLLPTDEDLKQMFGMDEIVMVGYPIGLWDKTRNLPIFRRGITATSPRYDFCGKKEFLIDCAVFPGSSGSPVFLYNMGFYPQREGGFAGGERLKLLGVLSEYPQFTTEGEIKVKKVPTTKVPVAENAIPTNLGYVIKSEKILEFDTFFPAS